LGRAGKVLTAVVEVKSDALFLTWIPPHLDPNVVQHIATKLWINRVISSESVHLSFSAIYVYAGPLPKRSQLAQGTVCVGVLSVFG
jgi:hypothetical protein